MDTSKLMSSLQVVQLAVTVGLAVLGFQLNREAESARRAIEQIETQLKVRQDERAAQEGAERLRFQLFGHVSTAIEKKDSRQQEAARALVIALLTVEDPLRGGLIEALSAQADAALKPTIERVAAQERAFREQQATLKATVRQAVAAAPRGEDSALARYYIDIFHCQNDPALKARADAIEKALQGQTARARLRPFADSVNASPGYRVSGLQVRYNVGEEQVAEALKRRLETAGGGEFALQQVTTDTPNYLSVFVCP